MKDLSGKIWRFGDDIDTDLMYPSSIPSIKGGVTMKHRAKFCMQSNRPGWADEVRAGDNIVAGKNYGCGSARDASGVLTTIGIKVIVAKSFSRIFFRNATNAGILCIENSEIQDYCNEGEILEVAVNKYIKVRGKDRIFPIPELPENVLKVLEVGGLLNYLRQYNGLPPIGGDM